MGEALRISCREVRHDAEVVARPDPTDRFVENPCAFGDVQRGPVVTASDQDVVDATAALIGLQPNSRTESPLVTMGFSGVNV